MPDQNNVLFSAEFEGEGLQRGVDDILVELQKLKENTAQLKKESAEYTKELKNNERAISDLNKEYEKANEQRRKQIATEIESINKRNAALKTEIDLNRKAIVEQQQVSKEVSKYAAKRIKDEEAVEKAIKKSFDVTNLQVAAVNKATGAFKAFGAAMLSGFVGVIIGYALPSIDELAKSLLDFIKGQDEAVNKQKLLREVFEQASNSVSNEAAKLEVFKNKLTDLNIPAEERIRIAKEYNKISDEQNKIDLKQIDNLGLINRQIDAQNKLILQRAIALAATNKISEAAQPFIESELKLGGLSQQSGRSAEILKNTVELFKSQITFGEQTAESRKQYFTALKFFSESVNLSTDQFTDLLKIVDDNKKTRKTLDDTVKALSGSITTAGLTTTDKTKPDPKVNDIENVFKQKLAELQSRLANTQVKQFESETLIRKKFAAQLDKEFLDIEKLLKEKKLTGPQADILKGLLQQINKIELDASLGEFQSKVKAAIQKINDEIAAIQIDLANKRVDNIRNEFEREAAEIEQGYQNQKSAIQKSLNKVLQDIDDLKEKGISEETIKRKKFIANILFADLLDQAGQQKINKELDLAFKTFQATLKENNAAYEELLVQNSEITAAAIRQQNELFKSGEISYKQYQKNVTKILQDEKTARDKIREAELNEDLKAINTRLEGTSDPVQRAQLEAQQRAIREQLASIGTNTRENKPEEQKRIDQILLYGKAVNDLLGQISSFWNQVNQVEAASLDRSIALQEKRVENARFIAEKGNVEYLELEQKRLDELERKREDNARRQIAINNALTLSNATLAAIGAISQAVQTGTALSAFAAVGAVVAAIIAAYSFVNSLQPQVPTFFAGTEYVAGAGAPLGKDTVPARLNIGERVVTTQDNKDYWQTLSAIHNHLIPPAILNSFVDSYPNNKVAGVDYSRLDKATQGKYGADSHEIITKFDQLNETMKQVVQGVSDSGISLKIDEDGFAFSVSNAVNKRRLRWKA